MKRIKKELPLIHKAPSNPFISKKQRNHFFNCFYFNIYPSNFDAHKILKPIDKEILSMIFTFGIQGKQFYVSNKQLANQLNVGKSTVKRSLKKLKDNDFIDYAYEKINNRITHRYITKFNFKKALGEPNKNPISSSNKSSKPTKPRIHKSHKNNNSNKSNQKPLTTNQKQQIKKAIHIIGRNVVSYNPKHLKNHFISEYQNGKLNFDKLSDALIKYQYNKMNNMSIPKPVGYICAVTHDSFNRNKVNQMKEALEANKHQDKEDDSSDDDRYGDENPIYNQIEESPKRLKQYYKKYGVKFNTSNKKDLKKLAHIFHINFNQSHDDFMEHLQNLIDTGKIGDIPYNDMIITYEKKHLNNNKKGK